MESFAIVVLILGLIVASLARRHLREAKQLELRQIIHQERMKAMEHNLSLPETNDPQLSELFGGFGAAEPKGSGWLSASVLWVRLVALCLGLAGFFGGIGTAFAMSKVKAEDMSDFWTMGLIPAFVGIGLLIFYAMSKSFAGEARQQEPESGA